jgi:hypothetical protein
MRWPDFAILQSNFAIIAKCIAKRGGRGRFCNFAMQPLRGIAIAKLRPPSVTTLKTPKKTTIFAIPPFPQK